MAVRQFLAIGATLLSLLIVAAAPAQPQLAVSSGSIDFGDVWKGSVVTRELLLINVGDEPLNLTSVRASCGCTVTELKKNQLAPGDFTGLDVALDSSKKRAGRTTVRVVINSNDPKKPSLVVPVTADIKQLVTVEPPQALRVISFDVDQVHTVDATLAINVDEPVKLELEAVVPDVLEVDFKPLEAGRKYALKATTKSPVGEQPLTVQLKFATDNPAQPTVSIPVNFIVRPRVQVTPNVILLNPQRPARTQVVRVSYFGDDENFDVAEVQAGHPGVQSQITEQPRPTLRTPHQQRPAEAKRILLNFPAPGELGNEDFEIVIKTTDPDFQEIKIPVTQSRERYREYFTRQLRGATDG